MNIKISIPKIMCDKVLERNGYVTEKLTLYYDKYDGYIDPYLIPNDCVVAYPEGRRPEVLEGEHPLMDDCEDFMYNRVVEDLFNSWLIEVMLKHY